MQVSLLYCVYVYIEGVSRSLRNYNTFYRKLLWVKSSSHIQMTVHKYSLFLNVYNFKLVANYWMHL